VTPRTCGRPILVTEDDLDAHIHVRGDLRQERDLRLDRDQVPQRQALGAMRPCPHPIHSAVAGFDPNEVLPQAADVLLDVV